MSVLLRHITAFTDLIYPRTCAGCGFVLLSGEKAICTSCLADMPFTGFENIKNNPVHELFWGRVTIEQATALIFYEKSTSYQNMLHQFKYHGKKQVGFKMGNLLGKKLTETNFNTVDCLVPVPLHPARERKRGYNQSEIIANGAAYALNKKIISGNTTRIRYTKTQTKKNRYERWQNIQGIFKCKHPEMFENKHILLIDDVITTGATLESLANELLKIKGVKISIATLAVAKP